MKRQLAAVLAADIVDYTRLMAEDAEATLGALRRLRAEAFGPAVASRRGRIVKNMGDGWIVLFGAASDAASCAMQIQDRLAAGPQPGEPEIRMRIGVHLGDVTEEDADVFGDGVNVAARLETATAPGSVAVSEAVFGSLDGTLRPAFDDAGAWELKNIDRPVQVWTRGESTSHAVATRGRAGGLRIAVQPVATSDERAEVRELADAITGDVTTYLDATMWGAASTTLEPGDAGYVLSQSLRSSGERLRFEAQLRDATGSVVLKEKTDGNLKDAFDLQDEIAGNLSGHVLRRVFDAEQARLNACPPDAMKAEDHVLYAAMMFERLDVDSMEQALTHAARALELEPERVEALATALPAYFTSVSVGYESLGQKFAEKATDWLAAAAALDGKNPLLDVSVLTKRRIEGDISPNEARRILDRALRTFPDDYVAMTYCGFGYAFQGLTEPAIDCLRRALTLGRQTPWGLTILGGLGQASLQLGQFERTIRYCNEALEISSGYLPIYRQLAAAHAQLGQMEEARTALAELLRVMPDDTVSGVMQRSGYADTPETRLYFDGLRMVGLPE